MGSASRGNRAGAYAQARYERGLRNYRTRARPIFAAMFEGHPLTWAAGVVTGTFAGGWLVLRDEPPAHIEHWREGAEGERKTARALRPLKRSGLAVLHDIQTPHGNDDHITVGRAGVFLMETKNLKGVVELRGGVPYVQRRLDPDAERREGQIRPRALSGAARLKEDIEHHTGHRMWVQAIVVFWSDFPEGLFDDGRCTFIHGPRLRAWMKNRPDRLDPVVIKDVTNAVVQIALEGASPNVPGPSGRGRAD